MFKQFLRDERGQSATEYILILSVIVAVVIAVGNHFKDKMKELVNTVMEKVEGAISNFTSASIK